MSWNQKNQIHKDVFQAFENLKTDRSFAVILNWLRTGLKEEDETNRRIIEDEFLRMGQGRAQALEIILYANDNARENLEKLVKL